MSVNINIKQKKLIKSKLGLSFIKNICDSFDLTFGQINVAGVFEKYGGGEEIADVNFIVYNQKQIGRGFNVCVKANELDLRINIPCTTQDIIDFFHFVSSVCLNFGTTSFEKDGEICRIDELNELLRNLTNRNIDVLINIPKNDFTVFGAVYPITLEDKLIKKLKSSQDAAKMFQDYLHNKQNNKYHYAKARIYQDENDGHYFGVFVFVENVKCVFAVNPAIPVFMKLEQQIDDWRVIIVRNENSQYKQIGELTYDEFKKKTHFGIYEIFDKTHIIIELNAKKIDELL